MSTFSEQQIRELALSKGTSMSWLTFIKSEEIANKIADRVWNHLTKKGYARSRKRKHVVVIVPSELRKGTWTVRVLLPGDMYSSLIADGDKKNKQEQADAVAALQASSYMVFQLFYNDRMP